jgi:hypothetical protein
MGERPIVPARLLRSRRFGTHELVNATSDLAVLSSVGAQIDDLAQRVTAMAERYGHTPDSAVATELFGAERALLGARRSLDRAASFLEESAGR